MQGRFTDNIFVVTLTLLKFPVSIKDSLSLLARITIENSQKKGKFPARNITEFSDV